MFLYKCAVEFSIDVLHILPILNDLGYYKVYETGSIGGFLVTDPNLDEQPCYYTTDNIDESVINCGNNVKLFMDLASASDSTDKNQIFVLDQGCVLMTVGFS